MSLFAKVDWSQKRHSLHSKAWYRRAVDAVQSRVDTIGTDLTLPQQPGGWIHNYISPDTWLPLQFDGQQPQLHTTITGQAYTGAAYDGAWRAWRHRQLADWARDAGILYHLLEQSSYAASVIRILLDYAELYTRFRGDADAEDWMLKGHAFNQALTEALWAVPLVQAYDLVRPLLSAADNTTICTNMLRPIAETLTAAHDTLIAQNRLASNYTAWLLAALGQLAFVLHDNALVKRVTSEEIGFPAHLSTAILPDGMEHEATPYYHNFVALAYALLAEACTANNINLYTIKGQNGQTIQGLWQAFTSIAYTDGSVPDANDGSYWQNSIYDIEICDVYEIAYARSSDALFGWMAHKAYQRRSSERDRWTTLLYATSDLPDATPEQPIISILPDSGMIVLRPSKALQAFIPYGAYAGSHSHYDRLALNIMPFSQDAGTPLYGIEERKTWYQQTLAHNTVVVDGQSQAAGRAYLTGQQEDAVTLQSDELYAGVLCTRNIQWQAEKIIDKFTLVSSEVHTYDWLFHSDAVWTLVDHEPQSHSGMYAETAPGCYVTYRAILTNHSTVTLQTKFQSTIYQLTLKTKQPLQLTLAQCPGRSYNPTQKRYLVIAQIQAKDADYHAFIERLS